jgi:hypothetical protein
MPRALDKTCYCKPFKLVEHPIFKAFIAVLQPKFKLHGRITVKKDIIEIYNSMKAKVACKTSQADLVTKFIG